MRACSSCCVLPSTKAPIASGTQPPAFELCAVPAPSMARHAGKSQFIKWAAKLAPRSVTTTGTGSSAAGLTATATRDGAHWALEAGALVSSVDTHGFHGPPMNFLQRCC